VLPSLLEPVVRFALSVSSQAVAVTAAVAGLMLIMAESEVAEVLALLVAFLAAAVLLLSQSAPEAGLAVALLGVFLTLMMQFTARERLLSFPTSARRSIPLAFRALIAVLAVWLAASIGVFQRPLDEQQFAVVWLVISVGATLTITTDTFKVGCALLMLLSAVVVYYVSSTDEISFLVLGLLSLSAFAVALATSRLALTPVAGEQE